MAVNKNLYHEGVKILRGAIKMNPKEPAMDGNEPEYSDAEKHAQELITHAYCISRSAHPYKKMAELHQLFDKRQKVCNELVNANAMNCENLIKMIDEINRSIIIAIEIPLPERKLK